MFAESHDLEISRPGMNTVEQRFAATHTTWTASPGFTLVHAWSPV